MEQRANPPKDGDAKPEPKTVLAVMAARLPNLISITF